MTSWGLENDRVYMIVNDKGVFVSQRELPHMVLIHPERGGEGSCLFFTYVRWVNLKIGGFSNMYDCHLHRRFPFSVPPSCPRLVHPAHVFQVQELHVYPVKGCKGHSLKKAHGREKQSPKKKKKKTHTLKTHIWANHKTGSRHLGFLISGF